LKYMDIFVIFSSSLPSATPLSCDPLPGSMKPYWEQVAEHYNQCLPHPGPSGHPSFPVVRMIHHSELHPLSENSLVARDTCPLSGPHSTVNGQAFLTTTDSEVAAKNYFAPPRSPQGRRDRLLSVISHHPPSTGLPSIIRSQCADFYWCVCGNVTLRIPGVLSGGTDPPRRPSRSTTGCTRTRR